MATTKKKEEQNQLEVQDVSSQNTSQQTGNGYPSQWQSQINDQVNQYLNREKFQYDVNEDALYQQMKDMYVMQGRQAMMDTIGQSTALTGGYGNSWAQGAGQQAYQEYIQQLNDSIPDLYQMALDQYVNEGDQMAQNIGMMMDMESTDYDRYWDQMADQDAEYEKLLTLMTKYKYEPTAEEMAAAGMTESQMNAILGKNKNKSSGGTGGSSGPQGPQEPQEVELSDDAKKFMSNLPYAHGGSNIKVWNSVVLERLEKSGLSAKDKEEIAYRLGL